MSDDEYISWTRRAAQADASDTGKADSGSPKSPDSDTGTTDDVPPTPVEAHRDPRRGGRTRRRFVPLLAAVAVVGAAGAGYALTHRPDGEATQETLSGISPATGSTSSTTSQASTSNPPATTAAAPTATRKAAPTKQVNESLAQLRALVSGDSEVASEAIDGRYVAMLSSKSAGMVDKLQTAASGGHKFGWKDILAEHEKLRHDPRFGSSVFILMSTDFGDAVKWHGRPLFVTVADEGFYDAQDVRSWCDDTFSDLSPLKRADSCTPAHLTSPN